MTDNTGGISVSAADDIAAEADSCSRELELREFPDKYVIRSVGPSAKPGEAFMIGRSDGVIRVLPHGETEYKNPRKISTIYGVVGSIRLLAGTYVLVITSRNEVGCYQGSHIYRVHSMRFLPCNEALKYATAQEKMDEAYFVSLLKMAETTPGLYFSYDRDLTLNLQRVSKLSDPRIHKPLWKQADPRFVWNRYLLEELIEAKLDAFAIPLIQGSFHTMPFKLKNEHFSITLISRKCNRRLGTRMWRRGANLEGAVANFVETEQLVNFQGFRSSFVQVRGSIPLLWEQIVDLSYKPQLNIIKHEETSKVVQLHFHDLVQRYGEIVAIDLTDQHGNEGELSRAYAAEMQKLPEIRYVSFDFHGACGKKDFDNLQMLYDDVKSDIEKQGYFLTTDKEQILMEQKGVCRSNCIDCLDRTNVTQSVFARKSLDAQLQRMGFFSSEDGLSAYNQAYDMFRNLWVDHGDQLSLQYAGSHALKRDLVRYGRQTVPGMLEDGISALVRYYHNNFQDGVRQDAIDLISGSYTVTRTNPSPFQLNGFDALFYLPVTSAIIVGGIAITSLTISQIGRSIQNFFSSMICAGITAGMMAFMKLNGKLFCSRPRLCGLF